MKRILVNLSLVIVILFSVSCGDEVVDEVYFDTSSIIGKWKSGTLFERYDLDNTGATWDTADDVTEAEAQPFTWTIEIDQLEQIHIIENGGVIPKVYTVTTLNETTLVYEDEYGNETTFSKQ